MTYAEAIRFLYGLQLFGARPGLETTLKLAALAGNPQEQLRFIHVAGTNGKGSTCAMLESIYRAAGLRVGLFTSPHLVSFRERIQVNRELISTAELARLAAEVSSSLDDFPTDQHPTMFEVVTVIALRYFAKVQCDVVIWETGLGGRLDATNIVTPLVSVITNIALDHQAWLGDTLEKIAAEKAGIIKPGVPVVTTESSAAAWPVIECVARELRAPLRQVRSVCSDSQQVVQSLAGAHQRLNAALASATVEVLQEKIPVTPTQIANGLVHVQWLGRLQLITRPDGQRFLLDGAHNLAGVETLCAALREGEFRDLARNQPPTMIIGMLGDKDWQAMCARLAPLAGRLLLVPVDSERTASPEALAAECRAVNPKAAVRHCKNLAEAIESAVGDPFVVIAGSLYLIGAALVLLDPAFRHMDDERGLNEWSSRPPATSPC